MPALAVTPLPSAVAVLLSPPSPARATMLLSPEMMAVLLSPRRAMAPMLLLPLTVAVLWLPSVAVAWLLSPVAVAVLLLPLVAVAVLPVPVTVAVHRLQLVASAVLPTPRATARECSPGVVIATVVSLGSVSRTITPLTDLVTGTFGFFFGAVDVVDAESVDEDVSGFDGLPDATNGIANIPAPNPRATA